MVQTIEKLTPFGMPTCSLPLMLFFLSGPLLKQRFHGFPRLVSVVHVFPRFSLGTGCMFLLRVLGRVVRRTISTNLGSITMTTHMFC